MSTATEVIISHSTELGARAFLLLGEYAHNGNAVQSVTLSADDLRLLANELLQAATELETAQ
jgi:hypothetical protein